MKVVIAGVGSVGFHLAEILAKHNHDVVLMDSDVEAAGYAAGRLDCLVVKGETTNPDTLRQAGVEDADYFIAVTNSDEVNMVACFLVSAVSKKPVKIARVRNIAYTDNRIMRHLLMGVDFLVNPEIEAARAMADSAVHGATGEVLRFERTDLQLRSVAVNENDKYFKGKAVHAIRKRLKEDFLVAGILRENEVIIPLGNTVIQENDCLQLVAARETLERVFLRIGSIKKKLGSILIVGGGRLGGYVTEYLLTAGRKIKILDADYQTCQRAAERFPDATVIHGNVSDEAVFEEEQLHKHDIIITATDNQELNILSGIYAKSRGVDRSIAVVHGANYLPMAASLGVDVPVCPKMSSVDAVLKFMRGENVKTVHSIFHGQAEVIEYTVDEGNPVCGVALKDINMPENSLIVAINRVGRDIIPDGRFVFKKGDNVLAFTKKDSVEELEKIFSG